jgi:hypothetical protein
MEFPIAAANPRFSGYVLRVGDSAGEVFVSGRGRHPDERPQV